MKKNITVNLFGTLYAIDDDACKLLEQYLTICAATLANAKAAMK